MSAVATSGANSHASREARRRRIVERGSDRLALITGGIQSLPPGPDQSRSSTCQTLADSSRRDDIASGLSLLNQESGREPTPSQHDIVAEAVEPLPSNNDKTNSTAAGPLASQGVEEDLSQISSSTRGSVQEPQREQSCRNPFTAGQISATLSATENIRTCFSIAAAVLVILSYTGFPILGCNSIRSIIIFRPVYLLLLTNISIVLARLILATQGAELRIERTSTVPTTLFDQLGKALESGLLLQNIVRALFMDFSIYTIVLVCGLSLVRRLGW